MKTLHTPFWLMLLVASGSIGGAEIAIGSRTIHVPDGYEIELAAGTPADRAADRRGPR